MQKFHDMFPVLIWKKIPKNKTKQKNENQKAWDIYIHLGGHEEKRDGLPIFISKCYQTTGSVIQCL